MLMTTFALAWRSRPGAWLEPDSPYQQPQSGHNLRDEDRYGSDQLDHTGKSGREQVREPHRQVERRCEHTQPGQYPWDVLGFVEDEEEDRRPCAEEDGRDIGRNREWIKDRQRVQLVGVERGGMIGGQIDL